MACNSCGKKKKTCDNKEFTKAVVEINNPETNVLIRKVVIPTSLGDDITNPPVVGKYCNVVLFYEANWHVYLYSSDGIPTLISDNGDVDFDRIQNRPWYNGTPMTSETRIPKVPSAVSELNNDRNYQTASQVSTTVSNAVAAEAKIRQGVDETLRNDIDAEVLARQNAITTLTNKINRDVMYDLEMSTSAQSVSFKEDKVNVVTGATSTEIDTIPAASSTTAGIITAAEYATLVDSEKKIEALLNGAIAITGLPSTPTQAELTTTWKNATGRDTLINRASIFDVDNQLVWTYYTNVDTWESAPSGQVSVSQFGNGTPGIITGSTVDGNVSANLDGTGTVSGWTTVKNDIATNTAAIANKANITDIPTVNNAALTIQKNGEDVAVFTANSSTDTVANIAVPIVEPGDFFTSSATDSDKGNSICFSGTADEKIANIMLEGDTDQTTYSGAQLLTKDGMATPSTDTAFWGAFSSNNITLTPQNDGWANIEQIMIGYGNFNTTTDSIDKFEPETKYTIIVELDNVTGTGILGLMQVDKATESFGTYTIVEGASSTSGNNVYINLEDADPISVIVATTKETLGVRGLRFFTNNDVSVGSRFDIRTTVLLGDHSSDWQNYCGDNWQPYVGGIVSPNPDYSQNINVVTGDQVVTVTDNDEQSQQYNISLGNIELCKIDDYQDYIYKDGEDWYIHKEVGKLDMSTISAWSKRDNGEFYRVGFSSEYNMVKDSKLYSNLFTYSITPWSIIGFGMNTSTGDVWIKTGDSTLTDQNDVPQWLAGRHAIMYGGLSTATNTKITDTDLITQLDTLWYGAHSYDGETCIYTQSDGTNLPFIIDATVVRDGLSGINYTIDTKQDILTAGNNITINNNVISASVPTVNNATLTIQENGTNVATFTANSSTNATANITVPTITMTSVDPGEGSPLAANNFIAVYEA